VKSALSDVTDAVLTLLYADPTIAAVPGGVWNVIPEDPITYPMIWFEVSRPIDARGFGTGTLPQCDVRTHVFTQGGSLADAYTLNGAIVHALADAVVPVDGTRFTPAGTIISEAELTLADELVRGVPVHEIVSTFRVYVDGVVP